MVCGCKTTYHHCVPLSTVTQPVLSPGLRPRLSPDSASPEASIVVPPYSDNCTLLLRSQAQDLAGAIAASPGVWYNVSAAPWAPSVSERVSS